MVLFLLFLGERRECPDETRRGFHFLSLNNILFGKVSVILGAAKAIISAIETANGPPRTKTGLRSFMAWTPVGP